MLRIQLPWLDPRLNPNRSRNIHWAQKAKVVKESRLRARVEAMAALPVDQRGRFECGPELPMTVTFCPPNRMRRDRDNLIASMKASFDGIADALGIDDNRFVPTFRMGEVEKGGAVLVEIGPKEAA